MAPNEADKTREILASGLRRCQRFLPGTMFAFHMKQATFDALAWEAGSKEKSFSKLAIRGELVPVVIIDEAEVEENAIYILPATGEGKRKR